MSRAPVSKSRADKVGKPPAAQTPVVSHEIVPGKFNDHDWNLMLDRDGSDDFIEDIVEGLIGNSLDKCFELYIQRQLIPFTVTQAKDAILSIIEWQFLTRDNGEKNPELESGWIEDEEPDPAETDCWAQGSVPRNYVPTPVPETILEEPEGNQEMQEEDIEEETAERDIVLDEELELEDQVSEDEAAGKEEAERLTMEEEENAQAEKKQKKRFKPYTGRMNSLALRVTESLEQTEMSLLTQEIIASMPPPQEKLTGLVTMPASCHSILKVQAGRPPGNKDVEYDDYGNVVAVIKLNPERLPNHRIKVNYQVVDPAVEAAQARLDAMKTGRYVAPRLKRRTQKKEDVSESICAEASSHVPAKTPLPPPMIETMELAPGVTVTEGGRVKQGPSRYIRRVDMMSSNQKGLKPICFTQTTPLDVSDILDRHTPILRPIHDTSPLPPIMAIPHPPEQPKIST